MGKTNIMTLPTMTFKEFAKNPIVALLFMCILAIGYLHVQHTTSLEENITKLDAQVVKLTEENRELNEQIQELYQIIGGLTE